MRAVETVPVELPPFIANDGGLTKRLARFEMLCRGGKRSVVDGWVLGPFGYHDRYPGADGGMLRFSVTHLPTGRCIAYAAHEETAALILEALQELAPALGAPFEVERYANVRDRARAIVVNCGGMWP
jgi:hypothetical protein